MNRGEVLDAVKATICQDRQDVHGDPEDTHALIAEFWNLYLFDHMTEAGTEIDGRDVAVMMALFKVARFMKNMNHADNLHDLIGYAAIAAELSTPTPEK